MDADEKHQFERKSFGCHGVNALGKTVREGAELGLNSFAIMLNQKGFGRIVWLFAVSPPRCQQPRAGGFGKKLFPGVIRISGVSI